MISYQKNLFTQYTVLDKQLEKTFYNKIKEINNHGTNSYRKNNSYTSCREQAVMLPRYLGIEAITAESFAHIHLANLVNFGILPLIFANYEDKNNFSQGQMITIDLYKILKKTSS